MAKQQITINETVNPVWKDGKYLYTEERQEISGQFVGENAISETQSFVDTYTNSQTVISFYSHGGHSTSLNASNVIVVDKQINSVSERVCTYRISLYGKNFETTNLYSYTEEITTQYPMERYNVIEVPLYGSVLMNKGYQTHEVSLTGEYLGDEYTDTSEVMRGLALDRITQFSTSYTGILVDNSVMARNGYASYSARILTS